ncbi:MAG: hypothetical protein ACHQT9_03825 [Candidatus Saccharimonadales bacterium]
MPPRQMNASQARAVRIPDHIQAQMDRHMQTSLPSNLKYYQQSGGYVPPAIQKQIQSHLEKTMPGHLQAYVSPYMHQKVAPQHFQVHQPVSAPAEHFSPLSTQGTNPQYNAPLTPTKTEVQAGPPVAGINTEPQVATGDSNTPQEPYDFILNKNVQKKNPTDFFTTKSMPVRIAMVVGGLVSLLVIILMLQSILAGKPKYESYFVVIQDQQEIIHLSSNAIQSDLPTSYDNFLATTNLTVSSTNSQLLSYLILYKQKITPQLLNAKVSPTLDAQLNQATSTGGYSGLFQSTMSAKLNQYLRDLNTAYYSYKGPKGRALIYDDFNQAKLLKEQFAQASSSVGT